jgi:hypothetical protein
MADIQALEERNSELQANLMAGNGILAPPQAPLTEAEPQPFSAPNAKQPPEPPALPAWRTLPRGWSRTGMA